MDTPLPSNSDLLAWSRAHPWGQVEQLKRRFLNALDDVRQQPHEAHTLPLDALSAATGRPLALLFDDDDPQAHHGANVILAQEAGYSLVLGSYVSGRYRKGKSLVHSIVPYHLNPSVNHSNLAETETPSARMRALGAEVELGLYQPDGAPPTGAALAQFAQVYQAYARKLGITPQVDHEACEYQIETHVAPGIGYQKTRTSLDGILRALMAASDATALHTAVLSAYPVASDFKMSADPKVQTAVDLMLEVNGRFPAYAARLNEARRRYHVDPTSHFVHMFRNQGCHIHLDIAGRSEGLGLFTFYTMLRSASAVANAAVLKGGPFVNGTCDADLLCTREYLRRTTVTGNTIEIPTSPHISPDGLARYGDMLRSEGVNAVARAMLIDESLGQPVSAMHNAIGRVRPDLGSSKRICTVESTGMPANLSAARMAAVLVDFEFSHALLELYFRKHGTDLGPMADDAALWDVLGPLSSAEYRRQQDESDRCGSDVTIVTAGGRAMSLVEFYDLKRRTLHVALEDMPDVAPRDIDDVYMSLTRMLAPPSGHTAQTVEQYISDPKLKSTGNWGRILVNTYQDEGGVVGAHNPDAVLRVVNRAHLALRARYLG